MAQNNDSPGKRLKREEAKNTLYVSRPDDPRLQMYRDSLALHNYSEQQSKIEGKKPPPEYWGPNSRSGNRSKITPNLDNRLKDYKRAWEESIRTGHSLVPNYGTLPNFIQKQEELFKTTKNLVDVNKNIEYYNNLSSPDIAHKTIQPIGYYAGTGVNDIYKKPERPVVYREPAPKPKPKPAPVITRTVSEIVEPLAPRQAPSPIFSREEIIAPVMRPVDVPPAPPMREPVMEEEVVTERPVVRKPPKAVMPRRAGGWSNQPLLMQLFPKLYER